MKSRYRIIDEKQLCFVTSTVQKWIPVFTSEKYFDILTGSFKYFRPRRVSPCCNFLATRSQSPDWERINYRYESGDL